MIATALLVASTGVSVLAQQGALAGKATAEAQQPYTENYRVQLRDPATGAIVGTPQPLDAQGRFSFTSLETNRRYLVELYLVKENRVVCTEGPFQLTTTRVSMTDIDIDCGKKPMALWLLAAGAGTAAVIAIATRSASQ